MYEGLEYVIAKMNFSMDLVCLLLRENWNTDDAFSKFRNTMADDIQGLYRRLLEYEMHCVAACHSHWTYFRNLLGFEGWLDALKKIKDAERLVTNNMKQYNSEVVKEHLRKLDIGVEAMGGELAALRKNNDEWRVQTLTKAHNTLIGKFNVPEPANRKPDVLHQQRLPNTCEWFRKDDRYGKWLKSKDVSTLLVSAPPGCGKSILSAYLIEEELRKQWPDEHICYYFFGSQTENTDEEGKQERKGERKSVTSAICALIHSLLKAYPEIVSDIEGEVDTEGEVLFRDATKLGNLFKRATGTPVAGQVICVLDALDECELGEKNTGLDWLLKWIHSFSAQGSPSKVKFFVTTQGLPHIIENIETIFKRKDYLFLSVEEEELNNTLQDEIKIVMEKRFLEFSETVELEDGPGKRDTLWKSMEAVSHGQRTYFWVKLVFEALYKSVKTQKEWEAIIESPPRTIFEAYDKLFRFLKTENEPRVKLLLHLVYAASSTRPLTISEANMATTIHLSKRTSFKSDSDLGDEMMKDKHFQQWVLENCGFFVSIYDGRLFFIHSTAKKYLERPQTPLTHTNDEPSQSAPPGTVHSFRASVSERAAHVAAAECCVAYLSMNANITLGIKDIAGKVFSDRKFLDYAASNWIVHFQGAQNFQPEGDRTIVSDIAERFAKGYLKLWTPMPGYRFKSWKKTSGIGYLSSLRPVIEWSFHTPSWQNDQWTNEPLPASVAAGQAKLLDHHLKDSTRRDEILSNIHRSRLGFGPRRRYQLSHIACECGHVNLVRYILEHGADIEALPAQGGDRTFSLLQLAVHSRSPEMARMLLDRGAEVDRRIDGQTALSRHIGARTLDPALIDTLLEYGASWNTAFDLKAGKDLDPILVKLCIAGMDSRDSFTDEVQRRGVDLEDVKKRAHDLAQRLTTESNPSNGGKLHIDLEGLKGDSIERYRGILNSRGPLKA